MNPLASHWVRLACWLLLASPLVAALVMFTMDIRFAFALMLTLYVWVLVCVILAAIAFGGLVLRVLGRGLRALRR